MGLEYLNSRKGIVGILENDSYYAPTVNSFTSSKDALSTCSVFKQLSPLARDPLNLVYVYFQECHLQKTSDGFVLSDHTDFHHVKNPLEGLFLSDSDPLEQFSCGLQFHVAVAYFKQYDGAFLCGYKRHEPGDKEWNTPYWQLLVS